MFFWSKNTSAKKSLFSLSCRQLCKLGLQGNTLPSSCGIVFQCSGWDLARRWEIQWEILLWKIRYVFGRKCDLTAVKLILRMKIKFIKVFFPLEKKYSQFQIFQNMSHYYPPGNHLSTFDWESSPFLLFHFLGGGVAIVLLVWESVEESQSACEWGLWMQQSTMKWNKGDDDDAMQWNGIPYQQRLYTFTPFFDWASKIAKAEAN